MQRALITIAVCACSGGGGGGTPGGDAGGGGGDSGGGAADAAIDARPGDERSILYQCTAFDGGCA